MAGSWLSAGGTPGLAWALVCALALGLALLLDWYLGEPPPPASMTSCSA